MSGLASLVRAGALALDPLARALASPLDCRELLSRLGYDVALTPEAHQRIGALLPVADDLAALPDLVAALDSGGPEAVVTLATTTARVADALTALTQLNADDLHALPGPLASPDAWADLAAVLPEHLLAEQLARQAPALFTALRLTGVCRSEGPGDRPRLRLDWGALGAALADPPAAVRTAIRWDDGFDGWPVQRELGWWFARHGLPVRTRAMQQEVADAIAGASVAIPSGVESDVVLFRGPTAAGADAELGLLFACTADGGGTIYVGNLAYGTAGAVLAFSDTFALEVTGAFDGAASIGVRLRPSGVALVGDEAALDASVALVGRPAQPWLLIGAAGATRVELDGVRVEAGITGTTAQPEAYVLVRIDEGALRFVLDLGAADGFLRGVIGDSVPAIEAGAELRWGTLTGLRFGGAIGLEVTLPLGLTAGPLEVQALTLVLGPDGSGARLAATVDATLAVGPFTGSLGGIGAAVELNVDPTSETPGGLAATLAFVPPTRIGLAIDQAEVVTGGGFVDHDPATGRYAGGLALDAFGVGISAIVVVDTEIRGDPDGWALYASLGATFPAPLPLGFGFTLIGVGGLLALNRTIDVDELAAALRTGAADSILFPDDIEADAEAVLAGLDLWFPTKEATTVVGPVAEIGWGSPTLISAQLGVIVAIPDLIITLLGSVEMLIPTPDEALMTLRMDVIGAVDVPGSTVMVAASLHDSNLLGVFELSGDMGFYARLSEQPLFLLSIGGYHPQFHPPGALPAWLLELRRVCASIPLGLGVEAVLTSYVAVTSNTFQFGGRVEIVATVEVALTTYTAEGRFGVNVLLVLQPFKIVARATAGVSVSAGDHELMGVQLTTRIEGPQPWYATGRASFTFFGVDVPFAFDVGSQPGGKPRELHDVATDVARAVAPPTGWETAEPGDSWAGGVVIGAELPPGLWARPDQVVEVRQSVAPLNRTITAFGEYIPESDRIDAGSVTLGGQSVDEPAWLDDWFAPAQFDRLDDTTRLSAPSYELMTAGVRFGDAGVAISANEADCTTVSREPEESIWPDGRAKTSLFTSPARNPARAGESRTVAGEKLALLPTTYTVVRRSNGQRAGAAARRSRSRRRRVFRRCDRGDRGPRGV